MDQIWCKFSLLSPLSEEIRVIKTAIFHLVHIVLIGLSRRCQDELLAIVLFNRVVVEHCQVFILAHSLILVGSWVRSCQLLQSHLSWVLIRWILRHLLGLWHSLFDIVNSVVLLLVHSFLVCQSIRLGLVLTFRWTYFLATFYYLLALL